MPGTCAFCLLFEVAMEPHREAVRSKHTVGGLGGVKHLDSCSLIFGGTELSVGTENGAGSSIDARLCIPSW